MSEKILEVLDLRTTFHISDGIIVAVDGISFHVNKGETLGIVGESGSGKSITALSIMRLIPIPPGRIEQGEVFFEGENLLAVGEERIREIRGNDIAMIFQEPLTSLNPVYTVGDQIAEAIVLHQGLSRKKAVQRAVEMLRLVGIPDPERRVHEYPFRLSGGMRQRVMIAMALSCNPKLLIADEPTTALDVTIQAQILDLMKKLKEELGMAIMMITHDLGVIAEMAERVIVMYAGKVMEEAPVIPLFRNPAHPYTRGLIDSIPRLDVDKERLHVIEGVVPNPMFMPKGCRFNPRCRYAKDRCRKEEPPLLEIAPGRKTRCWYPLISS